MWSRLVIRKEISRIIQEVFLGMALVLTLELFSHQTAILLELYQEIIREVFLDMVLVVVVELLQLPIAILLEASQDHNPEVFLGIQLEVVVELLPLPIAISFTVPILLEVELFLSQIFTHQIILLVPGLTPPLVVFSQGIPQHTLVRGPFGRV